MLPHKKKGKKNLPQEPAELLCLTVSNQQTFACKKCKKCFRKDTSEFEERYVVVRAYGLAGYMRGDTMHLQTYWPRQLVTKVNSDEYCPFCDNHFVIDAVTPKPALKIEGEDARIDSRYADAFVIFPYS